MADTKIKTANKASLGVGVLKNKPETLLFIG